MNIGKIELPVEMIDWLWERSNGDTKWFTINVLTEISKITEERLILAITNYKKENGNDNCNHYDGYYKCAYCGIHPEHLAEYIMGHKTKERLT